MLRVGAAATISLVAVLWLPGAMSAAALGAIPRAVLGLLPELMSVAEMLGIVRWVVPGVMPGLVPLAMSGKVLGVLPNTVFWVMPEAVFGD